MAKKRSHSKAAADEASRAALDVTSIIIPDLGKARHIIGAVGHTERAIYHARMAGQKAVKRRINTFRKALGVPTAKRTRSRRRSKR